jgi:hypothetical protein
MYVTFICIIFAINGPLILTLIKNYLYLFQHTLAILGTVRRIIPTGALSSASIKSHHTLK